MPVLSFSAKNLKTLACPPNRQKIDFHDARCKGLMLEIRESGGQTWYLRYRDHRGTQRQFRIGDVRDLGLSQARRRADELRTKIALGQDPSEEKVLLRQIPTLEEFVRDRYMPFVKGYKKSWMSDDSYLRNHILPAFGKLHLDEITQRQIISFHHGMPDKGYAVGTANRCLILMRYILNLALRWSVMGLTGNPTKDVPLFQENNHRERYLSPEEAQRLYSALLRSENPQLRYIVPLLILTGARKREVLDSCWKDFDLERRSWRIPMSKPGHARHVPISDGLVELLATIPRLEECHYVVPNPKTRKPYLSVYYSWHTARTEAGLADVRMHDLRHSFASFLINSGRTLYEVQRILGHTQIRTTQRYAHLANETLQEAANSVSLALGDALRPGSIQQELVPASR